MPYVNYYYYGVFQFTHPGRGATEVVYVIVFGVCFNSRTPGGVRPTRSIRAIFAIEFQFTHPGRGATKHAKT